MTLRFYLLPLAIILFYPAVSGQEEKQQVEEINFGILAGVNLQNFRGDDFWGERLDNKVILGYQAGLIFDIRINSNFYLRPGFLYSVKGSKKEITEIIAESGEVRVITSIRLSYLEVPVNLLYRPQIDEGHILIGLGPYAAFGTTGKVKTKGGDYSNVLPVTFKKKVTVDDPSDYAYYRGMDAGANFLVGYELSNGILCQINMQLGFLKLNPRYDLLSNDKTSYKNIGFSLAVGYSF
jgi:hypothetical protein